MMNFHSIYLYLLRRMTAIIQHHPSSIHHPDVDSLPHSLLLIVIAILILKVVVVGGGVLILLVFGDEIVHIALGLGELHFVHSLSSVSVEECFASKHGGELFTNSLEHILNGSGVPDEGGGHLQSLWRDIADGRFDIVRDPLHKIRRVLILNIEHLLIHFFGAHSASEHC